MASQVTGDMVSALRAVHYPVALIVLSIEISARDLFAEPLLYIYTHTHLALRSNLLAIIDYSQC